MADHDIDLNLLFGVLALQDDLIDQAQFADACAGWCAPDAGTHGPTARRARLDDR